MKFHILLLNFVVDAFRLILWQSSSVGAPKQKWTAEEESALKAGVIKHGAGKWRTILKHPEFSGVLYTRSNVDLKDKWRNMSVMANGWGFREKAKKTLRTLWLSVMLLKAMMKTWKLSLFQFPVGPSRFLVPENLL
ncbi:hypothetical protein FF1_034905 [Malus domestica]